MIKSMLIVIRKLYNVVFSYIGNKGLRRLGLNAACRKTWLGIAALRGLCPPWEGTDSESHQPF